MITPLPTDFVQQVISAGLSIPFFLILHGDQEPIFKTPYGQPIFRKVPAVRIKADYVHLSVEPATELSANHRLPNRTKF